jgi:glycosyltransferase involved in cell wall biosynthesis
VCGVRDHSNLLAGALRREGLEASVHWLNRRSRSVGAARAEIRHWGDRLEVELRDARTAAIVLVYSVFAYSHRGVPLFVPSVLRVVRRSRLPVVLMLHELAYPWNQGGWRGKVWSLTQRAMLLWVMRAGRAVVVTSQFQGEWVLSRHWLPRRPLAVAPVFSNLPAPSRESAGAVRQDLIGVFGYAYQGVDVGLVLDAIGELHAAGIGARLLLLGFPGAASPAGQEWLRGARARDLQAALSFTGTLPAQELSDALATCAVLVFPDRAGPSSRKGSLAGALASGRPVVAIDGPRTWAELVSAQAIRVVDPGVSALAEAVASLLRDGEQAHALGARGRAFAETRMGLTVTAAAVRRYIEKVAGERGGAPPRRPLLHADAASS